MTTSMAKPVVAMAFALAASLLLAAGAAADEKKKTADLPEIAENQPTEMREMFQHSAPSPRLLMPMMNPARGRTLYASKGCVTCHSINGIGGEDAPNLDAHSMQPYMNPFEFAARMWRGAAAMIALQEEILGEQIEFTGDELADLIAFLHDDAEQHRFSEADIPPHIMPMMSHMHGEPGGGRAAHAEELGHTHAHGEDQHGEDQHGD